MFQDVLGVEESSKLDSRKKYVVEEFGFGGWYAINFKRDTTESEVKSTFESHGYSIDNIYKGSNIKQDYPEAYEAGIIELVTDPEETEMNTTT